MSICQECQFEAKNNTGLAAHRLHAHGVAGAKQKSSRKGVSAAFSKGKKGATLQEAIMALEVKRDAISGLINDLKEML